MTEHDWLKQWLVCDFLVAESDEPICIPRQLKKVCGVTIAGTSIIPSCDASQTGLIKHVVCWEGLCYNGY